MAAFSLKDILSLEAIDGVEPMSERSLQAVAHAGSWVEQRTRLTLGS